MKRYLIAAAVAIVLLAIAWLVGPSIIGKKNVPEQEKNTPLIQTKQQDSVATSQLPPLPADSKQAVDGEMQAIDQELANTESSLSSDTFDTELGL